MLSLSALLPKLLRSSLCPLDFASKDVFASPYSGSRKPLFSDFEKGNSNPRELNRSVDETLGVPGVLRVSITLRDDSLSDDG